MNHKLILDLLIAGGHVTQEKVDQASAIVEQFSQPILKAVIDSPEPDDHKLTFPDILRPYLRVDMGRTVYEARKNGVSMEHLGKTLEVSRQAISHVNNYYRKTNNLKKYPRYNGTAKEFKMYYEVNSGKACYELRKQGMEYPDIKNLIGNKTTPSSAACQYAKNHNQPWPITFAD